jgi:tetratricopeptide (TPR) repeat protein
MIARIVVARGLLLTALIAVVAPACRPEDQETGSLTADEVQEARAGLDPALVAALDSGNAAYRAWNYTAALERYRAALELDDEVAAAWFGVSMAQLALGNGAAADSAMARARALAPGATLIHPQPGGTR